MQTASTPGFGSINNGEIIGGPVLWLVVVLAVVLAIDIYVHYAPPRPRLRHAPQDSRKARRRCRL